ncbi:hypothetical protein [Roseisolibacter sp. H3M3-2]|uniref:hypothetical protein n=1 Tax=Roseisolibacter sp. H3M3-2 TaxID=3031323 RepID=UPI0023DBD851|nr:hypothetical protein [Roseisolibacter sp. H3M3-2]MDF1506309.1 hypothetical protein [Roseisolibacter sp. H3M3-2]
MTAHLVVALAFLAALAAPEQVVPVTKTDHKVKVEGRTFRVTVWPDGKVEVAHKAFVTALTLEVRDQMRVAVKEATGCTLVDEFIVAPIVQGKLRCQQE